MKTVLLFLCILGFAVFAAAQTASAARIDANSVRKTGPSTFQFRGAARITSGTTVITADEVDAQTASDGSMAFDLRGNVHMTAVPR